MTMIAPTDVRSLNLATQGCGKSHEAGDLPEGTRWELDCVMCEPVLQKAAAAFGWATHHAAVKPTCDEIAQYERDEKEANRVGMRNMAAMTAAAAAGSVGVAPAPQLSILEQIARMSQEEKDALRAVLGSGPSPEVASPVEVPAEPIVETSADDAPPVDMTPDATTKAPAKPRASRKSTAA